MKYFGVWCKVSIHVPLARHDTRSVMSPPAWPSFNPRSPCETRLNFSSPVSACGTFQSTRPLWGTTIGQGKRLILPIVSIHAPLAGHDGVSVSLGGTTAVPIHAPLARHDSVCQPVLDVPDVSIHVPLARHDGIAVKYNLCLPCFNPRASCEA